MSVIKWLLPTFSEILARSVENGASNGLSELDRAVNTNADGEYTWGNRTGGEQIKAEREWSAAIAALEVLLRSAVSSDAESEAETPQGLILAGPVPVLTDSALISRFQTWTFSTHLANPCAWMPFQLPPAQESNVKTNNYINSLPLLPVDPLAAEQFCLVLTANFSLAIVLGEDGNGTPAFMFSFEPEIIQQAWAALKYRMFLSGSHHVDRLDSLCDRFAPKAPDYRTVMQFTRLLLKYLPAEESKEIAEPVSRQKSAEIPIPNSQFPIPNSQSNDVELLQAFAHEVRTPLATIRTLTRLLLRRKELASDIIKRLEIIDRECSEQIDRMELLFRAAELETSTKETPDLQLTPVSLAQVFQDSLPRWEEQALRRNQTLNVVLPKQMPQVVSDPTMLDRVLTSLIENFARNLPAGSHIQVQVMPAGDRLKLQLQPQNSPSSETNGENLTLTSNSQPTRKQIGQLLMFQPETGSLCLNHSVTKNIFQALGGKLIVRQKPQQGEVLTIFLPLEPTKAACD